MKNAEHFCMSVYRILVFFAIYFHMVNIFMVLYARLKKVFRFHDTILLLLLFWQITNPWYKYYRLSN